MAFAPAPSAAQSNGIVKVGRTAPNDNCTTNSLQDAIDLAKTPEWDDIIWISNDLDENFFSHGTLTISDQNVEIVGGFENCGFNDGTIPTPSGYLQISGAGGSSDSVFTIRGHSRVWLGHLEIVGGDDGDNDDGGGIDFKGSGSLTLNNLHLIGNRAGYGGGMLLRGGDADLDVTVGDDVLISDNTAVHNGGGIHVSGPTHLTMHGDGFGLHRNVAEGINGVDGQGGGLYLKIRADASIRANGFYGFPGLPRYPVFLSNRALRGGAIAATGEDWGGDAPIRLSSYDGSAPLVIQGNQASEVGGAIYLGAYSGDTADSAGWVCADDTAFRDNTAPDGAAVFASSASSVLGDDRQGTFITNYCAGAHRRCPAGAICSEFSGNRAVDAAGQRTAGDIIDFPGNAGELQLHRTRFVGNIGGSLVRMGDHSRNLLLLDDSLIFRNDLSGYVVDSDANQARIRHTTIVDNQLSGSHVLRMVESNASGFENQSSLTNSIIAQPGVLTLKHEGATVQSAIQYVMASDVSTLPADPTVTNGNPAFASPSADDYHPGRTSMAVDVAPTLLPDGTSDDLRADMLGDPRTVDLPERGDPGFPRDLGALEVQPRPRPGPIFRDDFEIDD